MSYKIWVDSMAKKLSGCDIGWVKISVFAFALMIAKLWQPILSLEWYCYAIICALAAIKPVYSIFFKK